MASKKRMDGRLVARPDGRLRQSQLVTTFGPGAMVDLVDRAVVIGGLEHWGFGREGFEPIELAVSMDWKLKQVNKLERRDFKNVSDFETDDPERARSLIRINGHCNMSCAFCFVDRTVPDFEAEQIIGDIERMAAVSTAHMVLSGGEPTLHPALARFIARAKELDFRTIEIQSNGSSSIRRHSDRSSSTVVFAGPVCTPKFTSTTGTVRQRTAPW